MRKQEDIKAFLTSAFDCRENTIPAWNFDREGNLSFGVRDYTDFPGQEVRPRHRYLWYGHHGGLGTSGSPREPSPTSEEQGRIEAPSLGRRVASLVR